MKKVIFSGLFAALLMGGAFAAAPAFAQQPAASAAAATGQVLFTSSGARLGRVVRVNDDGSVGVIFDGVLRTIPAATLSRADERLVTSLSRREVYQLN